MVAIMADTALVIGGTGMIGSAVVDAFSRHGLPVRATARNADLVPERLADVYVEFDARTGSLASLVAECDESVVVINCLGRIKQGIDESSTADAIDATLLNAVLPLELAALAQSQGFRVVHVTTDCVFSGARGTYSEPDLHDATDVYGKSKSLGEAPSTMVLNLRCSVVGPELRGYASLLEWLIRQPEGAVITGYTDHLWNGVTARALGDIIAGMLRSGHAPRGVVHLVPGDTVSKAELCSLILDAWGRRDVSVEPRATGSPINRILATERTEVVSRLWKDAGYPAAPNIADMIRDMNAPHSFTGVNS
jgi:dTDP-4-dehydrorhamnose reductase